VLTSAHCLLPPFEAFVISGLQSFNLALPITLLSEGQIRKVSKTKLHEKFRTESQYDYDIAIASVDEEFTFGGIS
jgi:hypothetical protein